MNKYYILNLDPQATHEWDRCVLRNPMTGARPDLNAEVAKVINAEAGSYLIKVDLQIEILEQSLSPACKAVELPAGKKATITAKQRLAS
ncbi:MAG: hypothetical protein RLZZ381_891 [Cyanobacteriota bacterium]|jgi:hypothetical protein